MIRKIEINGKTYRLIGEGGGDGDYTLTEEDLKEIAERVKFSTVVEGRISDGIGGKDYDLEIGTEYKFIPNVLETNIFVLFGGKYMALIRSQDTEPFTLKVIGSENKKVTYEYNGELLTKDYSGYSDLGATYASALFAYNFKGTIYRAMGDGKTPEKGIDYFTPEDVEVIVNEVAENVTTARTGTVTIFADKWTGTSSPYAQVVTVEGVTKKSQVDLTPSDAQLAIFHEKDLAFVTSNYRGVVTVSVIGQKPMNDYEMQVTITEVEHPDENSPIIGVTVGTPISPSKIEEKINPVKTVNNVAPNENGNVEIEIPKGANGLTPYIKDGNWWIGETDTGVKAEGADGVGISKIEKYSTNGKVDTYMITYTNRGASVFAVTNGTDGKAGEDGYTPIKGVDYYTEADKSEFSQYIASELAKRGQLKPEPAQTLADMTDTSLMYVLLDKTSPDYGYIFAYVLTEKEVESKPTYNNLLDDAINADKTPYTVTNEDGTTTVGYRKGWRINSSNVEKQSDGNCMTGYIPVRSGQTIRVKNIAISQAGNGYFHWYNENFTISSIAYYENNADQNTKPNADGLIEFNAPSDSALRYFRMTTGVISDETIITVDEEITESGGTEIVTEYAWANTELAFVSADYEDRIVNLENDVENLKKGISTSTPIKDWDAPIYDTYIPVFELSAEKSAMTNATNTPNNIYDMYDALMAKHPRYITKTDLGLCSDGVNHVYRYDFREPEPLHESNKEWSETKAKAIIVTGIHFEWAGIYAMYYALEEIADNPKLRNFRRNTHLIVVPCCNPYATIADNYQSGLATPNSQGVRNANGVEIHRNFEVDWVLTEEGTTHYGGAEPLSEVETQYIDDIMKENTDASFFLSCHNCGVDTFWGTGFIWASTATKYMCNMGYRVIDKMSNAWMDKYGDILSAGIEEYKTDLFEDGETRLGWTGLSTTAGTEAKQATKYGIQGTNVEICNPFQIHGTKANPEPSMSAFTMSRGAEVYINFLLTAFGVYDAKDKSLYGGK